MSSEKINDTLSREKIVKELKRNFFVEASAGSGKTTSLVFRMVALIEQENVPVDKICTITFTKAAANEFFLRFQTLLSKRSVDIPDDSDDHLGKKTKETIRRCQEALKNIDLCFLGTIDSFLNMIAHELPTELGIPSDSSVLSKDEYLRIIREEYYNILRDETHPRHTQGLLFNNTFNHADEFFFEGISTLSSVRYSKIDYDSDLLKEDFDTYLGSYKDELLGIMESFSQSEVLYNPKNDGSRNEKYGIYDSLINSYKKLKNAKWHEHIKDVCYAMKDIGKLDGFSKDMEVCSVLDYCDAPKSARGTYKYSEDFKEVLQTISDKIHEYRYSLFFDFVTSVLESINKSLKDAGKFQFFDFLYYITNAFRKSASTDRILVDHILERHAYFLLDESQDTDPMQTELFFYLTGTEKTTDWTKVKPREGSLFIVGDPKQSIYSFRGANVQSYLNTKEIFKKEDEVLVLTKNFRSNAQLRKWFNETMNCVLDTQVEPLEHLDIPIDQEDLDEEIPNGVLDGVYKYFTEDGNDEVEAAKIITSIVGKQEIFVKNKNRKPGEPQHISRVATYGDFLVVPRGTDVKELIKTFEEYHIPMTIEASIPFGSASSFKVLRDLTLLLKDPTNRFNLINVLNGPLYRLNDNDIISMINDGFDLDISNLDEEYFGDKSYYRYLKELKDLYEETRMMCYSSTMLYVLNNQKLNIFKKISSKNLEYTYFLIEKIKEQEVSGDMNSIDDLNYLVDRLINSNDEQRTIRFKQEVNRVKISNLHKVKGLEAPIVILIKPRKMKRDAVSHIDYENNGSIPVAQYSSIILDENSIKLEEVKTKRYESSLELWNGYQEAEKRRLEYVAATRPRSVLIIGHSTNLRSNYQSPWEDLIPTVEREFAIPEVTIPEKESSVVELGTLSKKEENHNSTHNYVSPSALRKASGSTNKDEIDDASFEMEEEHDSTLIGTIIHKLMECLVASRNDYKDIDALIEKIAFDYHAEKYLNLLKNTAKAILNGGFMQKNSSLPADILNELLSAKQVWCEVPFSYQNDKGNIISGVIDCLYLDKENMYHIIDYKTNKEDDVKVLKNEYEKQLAVYQASLRKLGINATAHIYHIDINKKS